MLAFLDTQLDVRFSRIQLSRRRSHLSDNEGEHRGKVVVPALAVRLRTPPAGGTSEPSLPPVASSHSTSILDRGCPGLSLKELSTSTTLLISSPVPLRPSSPTAFPGTLCRHSLVARLSPHLWCRVGGGALDCSRAGLRPPLKPCMQFSRTRLSRRRSSLSGDRRDHLNLCR